MTWRVRLTCGALLVASGIAADQGTSPMKVDKITLSPATFKAGNSVTVAVTVRNGGTKVYGCPGENTWAVWFIMTRAEPSPGGGVSTSDFLWSAYEPLGSAMKPGESRTVAASHKWLVPALDLPSVYAFAAGGGCSPDHEFQSAVVRQERVSFYQAAPVFKLMLPADLGPALKMLSSQAGK